MIFKCQLPANHSSQVAKFLFDFGTLSLLVSCMPASGNLISSYSYSFLFLFKLTNFMTTLPNIKVIRLQKVVKLNISSPSFFFFGVNSITYTSDVSSLTVIFRNIIWWWQYQQLVAWKEIQFVFGQQKEIVQCRIFWV